MVILNAAAALTGLIGFIVYAVALPAGSLSEFQGDYARSIAVVQMISALGGLFAGSRAWRFDLVAGAMMIGGAAFFALQGYLFVFADLRDTGWIMFLGGTSIALGWMALALSGPATQRPKKERR